MTWLLCRCLRFAELCPLVLFFLLRIAAEGLLFLEAFVEFNGDEETEEEGESALVFEETDEGVTWSS
ncbi:hypothetical protein A0J61_09198 [Choanephora cucurbitarum]|uniref:Uncharacterized protein n=1 Tax=Choanephora cucurbitarum TaxID=101091 RepID=A0A1C7N151_9FUNG|nr:hypothetical protein A0J61_09198 [Choanephora cucurbitarum]